MDILTKKKKKKGLLWFLKFCSITFMLKRSMKKNSLGGCNSEKFSSNGGTMTGQILFYRCPGWSVSSLGAQSFCWFCHEVAQLWTFFQWRHRSICIFWSVFSVQMKKLWVFGFNKDCSDCAHALADLQFDSEMSRIMTDPTRWPVRPTKTQISQGIRPVWSSQCAQWVAKDPSFLHADSEDSDQTARMPRLIWVFTGRTLILLVLSCRGSKGFIVPICKSFICCQSDSYLAYVRRKLLEAKTARLQMLQFAWAFPLHLCVQADLYLR